MKPLLTCLLFFATAAFALEIQVKGLVPDGEMERSFVLATSLTEKVVIDCQSFIQGLRIGEEGDAVFFLLDPFECEGMQKRVKGSLKRNQFHCIDVDVEIRSDYSC